MDVPINLRSGAFAGTAQAYLRFRPAYPQALLGDLLRLVSGRALYVDLACGPGRVALELAAAFAAVWAVDQEPDMIAAGQEEAARRGITHVDWRVGRAEDLALAADSVDLITIGEAFHRVDQSRVVRNALRWLKPGGAFVTLGTEGLLAGREPWQKTVVDVAQRWMSRASAEGFAQGYPGAELGPGASERVMRREGLVDVESRDFTEPHDWSFEEIAGYLTSTSVCSPAVLGPNVAAFETELATALGAGGRRTFHEELRSGYTVGRKPPA